MLQYMKYQNNVKLSSSYGKWYARLVQDETVDLDGLCEHMAKHNTGFSKGQIKGIITDMVGCIGELVLDGKKVKIPNLGIFFAGMNTKGATTAEEFTVAANVTRIYLRCLPTGQLSTANIVAAAKVREYGEYSLPVAETV